MAIAPIVIIAHVVAMVVDVNHAMAPLLIQLSLLLVHPQRHALIHLFPAQLHVHLLHAIHVIHAHQYAELSVEFRYAQLS